ncbi:MAG: Crp/Fnr family transcriptional regulator [Pseudolabrys sp.]|nr:Crp/Fnr family transcriptional regulator [Pseudolabrys sp.]
MLHPYVLLQTHGEFQTAVAIRKKKTARFDPKAFLTRIGAGRTNVSFLPNEIVFAQGDVANAVFFLQKGKAKITVLSKNGKEAVLAILGPDDFFGEGCLNGHPRRIGTVRAMTECSAMRIEKAAMIKVLHDEPKFSELFIAHLLHRNGRIEEDLIDQLFNSSEKRLARTLLLLANFGKEGKPEPVIAKLSQETLADMIGTTRSRVSFFMNRFRRLGFIEYDGDLHGDLKVHSSLLNVVLHDDPIKRRRSRRPACAIWYSTALQAKGIPCHC